MSSNLVRRTFVSLIGLMLCGVGVAIFLWTGLGVDPASVFELGVGKVFHISYGTSAAVINVVILIVVFFIDKSYINISSILAIFGIGYTADIVSDLLQNLNFEMSNIIVKLILVAVGLTIMAVGIATYIRADLGVGAIDLISEIISEKAKLQYRVVRVVGDISFVVIGFLLGGTFGIGTLVAAFMTGPTVQLVRPVANKIVDTFLNR
ncbi:MAG: membrane protein [Bacillota bacterium]|nr:membrane protein [Bacillota bacterium]